MTDRPVLTAETPSDVARCWPVMQLLRPHLSGPDEFVARWQAQQAEGYRLVYVEESGQPVAVAGYRMMTTLAWGRCLYLDDLVASEGVRGKGFGTRLLDHLKEQARELGCDCVHLDTGYQRNAAHVSYLRNGFILACHHMSWTRQA